MAIEQHAEFVDAVDDLVLVEDVPIGCCFHWAPAISSSDRTASSAGR